MKYTTLDKELNFTNDHIDLLRKQLIRELTKKEVLPIQTFQKLIDDSNEKNETNQQTTETIVNQIPQRRIINKDLTSCWLNSCLQLLLTAFDASATIPEFNYYLGIQLRVLHSSGISKPLDPSEIRKVLSDADNLRIENQKDFYRQSIEDQRELRRRLRNVEDLRLNLGNGQQCVRDFFVCLTENKESWLDVYMFLNYNVQDSRKCRTCGNVGRNEIREEIYTEISCPPDGSELSEAVEDYFNHGEIVEYNCDQGCGTRGMAEKNHQFKM